jgi:glycosyltransferase involved in cell wall biosynthesis
MPVYNGKAYLREAIDSVMGQTIADWELLVIDDGSTDGSIEFVQSNYADTRIRLLTNKGNRGVAYTRDRGVAQACGQFLAWLDCDDFMEADRLERQLDHLREHSEIGLCGTWIKRFGGDDHSVARPPTDPELLRSMLLFTPIVPNATVMLRLPLVRKLGVTYDQELPIAEDYDFVLQCSQRFAVGMVPKVLYHYRVTEGSLMQRFDAAEQRSFAAVKVVQARALRAFGIEATDDDLRLHRTFNSAILFPDFATYRAAFEWLMHLLDHNDRTGYYDRRTFRKAVADRFYFISKKASRFGNRALAFYLRNTVAHRLLSVKPVSLAKFTMRCLIRYNRF